MLQYKIGGNEFYIILVENPPGKHPLHILRIRLEVNIKMVLRDIHHVKGFG
jgi:hypothetical protein